MEYTDVTFDCYGTTVSPDTEEFRVEATVTAEGELPTTAIFVFLIGDADDAATDTFARVANPQDLINLQINRDATITAEGTEYLASYASFQYPNLTVGVNAKALLKTRINELISQWITYHDVFIADSGESQPYPSTDPAVEDTLKSDYTTAVSAREDAEAAVVVADTALTAAQNDADTAQSFIEAWQKGYDFTQTFSEKFYQYVAALLTEGSEAAGIRSTSLTPSLTSYGAECASQLQFWINQKAVYETEIATTTQTKIEAEQTLASAQAAEDEALAAVLAVCPDFDPATA